LPEHAVNLRIVAASNAIIAAFLPSAALAQDAPPVETITVGVFTVAPYVIAGDDGPRGALVDFFDREIAPRMHVRFQWERPMTVARLEQSLVAGRVLFTPILAKTTAREQAHIQFAGAPQVRFSPAIAVRPDHPLNALASPADLSGLTIGWVQAGALPPFMQDSHIRLELDGAIDWERTNLEKLRLGRIGGAYFSDRQTARYYAARTGMQLKLLNLPVPGTLLYAAFAPSVPPALVERYLRAASEAFAGNRFNTYLNRAVTEP
jgi:ABC-type amino acid transport substrate-binding protein